MLVPLTDSTNPYAVMMLELIRNQKTRRAAPRVRLDRPTRKAPR